MSLLRNITSGLRSLFRRDQVDRELNEEFAALGTQPVLGRSFSPDEQELGHDQVGILSHHLWRDRFGSNPAIIGKPVILNGKSCAVIGVMPANFRFPSGDVDLWQPLPSLLPCESKA